MSRTVPEAKLLGRAILGSIALGGVAECLEIETGGGGAYSSSTQHPQSLTRADQAEIGGRTLVQFYNRQSDGRVRALATGLQTMQYWPYRRFAYAISVIPEGQGGGCSFIGITLNDACQICRADLLVRNPLRTFAVQEMRIRSLGWTRENI